MVFDIKNLIKDAQGIRLLYVEDNEEAREATYALLSNIFSNIIVAVDGKDGLEKFQTQEKVHLVLTDINMPLMDGVEMAHRIKKIDKEVKIFFLSADDTMKDICEYDCKDIKLSKPFDVKIFAKKFAQIRADFE